MVTAKRLFFNIEYLKFDLKKEVLKKYKKEHAFKKQTKNFLGGFDC